MISRAPAQETVSLMLPGEICIMRPEYERVMGMHHARSSPEQVLTARSCGRLHNIAKAKDVNKGRGREYKNSLS